MLLRILNACTQDYILYITCMYNTKCTCIYMYTTNILYLPCISFAASSTPSISISCFSMSVFFPDRHNLSRVSFLSFLDLNHLPSWWFLFSNNLGLRYHTVGVFLRPEHRIKAFCKYLYMGETTKTLCTRQPDDIPSCMDGIYRR